VLMPGRAWRAAKATGVPFYILCAFLMQETGGGRNVYGHDVDSRGLPRPFWGHGLVTRENYAAYLVERDLGIRETRWGIGRRSQGVGPMQLTWWEFQDEADKAGGCWDPEVNVLVGARILARHRSTGKTWHGVALAYNGKESYADQMDERFRTWRRLMAS